MKFLRIAITPELFVQLFKTESEHRFKVLKGLPDDAQILDVQFENYPRRLYLLTYSSHLEGTEVREGEALSSLPLLDVVMETLQ